jgi:hypothetical protein
MYELRHCTHIVLQCLCHGKMGKCSPAAALSEMMSERHISEKNLAGALLHLE